MAFTLTSRMLQMRCKRLPTGEPHAWGWRAFDPPERIEYVTTRPYLGGIRHWFLCPRCKSRRRVLYAIPYAAASGWRCRVCWNLRYDSQRQRKRRRLALKYERLESELTHVDAQGTRSKPPRMHWRTYENRRLACEALYFLAVAPSIERDAMKVMRGPVPY